MKRHGGEAGWRRSWWCGAAWALLGWVCLAAEDARPGSGDLGVEECVAIAVENSPLILRAGSSAVAASEAAGAARAAYYPTLGLRGGASRWQSHAFLPSGLPVSNIASVVGPTDDWSAGGVARYTLYDGGARRSASGVADAERAASECRAEGVRQGVVLAARSAFFGLASAVEQQSVAVSALSNAVVHAELARQRQVAGAATEADVLRAQVEVDASRAALARARGRVSAAAGLLNTTLGRPPETPVTVRTALPGEGDPVPGTLAARLARAGGERPEVRAAAAAVVLARRRLDSAGAAYRPKVSAEAAYGWRDDSASLDDEAWSAGVTVEWTAFDGFSRRHATSEREAELAAAESALQQVRLAVQQDVWVAWARVSEQREVAAATATQQKDALEAVRLMGARYRAGAVSISELLDAQTALTAAEGSRVQARWDLAEAEARLEWATGGF